MAYFEWSEKFSLGNEVVDTQHKKLVEIINNLYEVNQSMPRKKEDIINVLNKLSNYIMYHFSEEEKMMKQHSYSFLKEHINYHHDFTKIIKEFKDRSSLDSKMAEDLLEFLKVWLAEHILKEDKKFIESL